MVENDFVSLSLMDSYVYSMTILAKLQTYFACGMGIIASDEAETNIINIETNAVFYSLPGYTVNLTKIYR